MGLFSDAVPGSEKFSAQKCIWDFSCTPEVQVDRENWIYVRNRTLRENVDFSC